MIHNIVITLFYAAFALFALWGTWSTRGKRQVGVALFLCWVASNVIFWTLPIYWRPQLFPILDVLFALTAAKAGMETNSRVPLVLISLSILAVTMNAAFSLTNASPASIYPYEVVLNIVFAAQCLITGAWGKGDELARIVRLWRSRAAPRAAPQPSHGRQNEDG